MSELFPKKEPISPEKLAELSEIVRRDFAVKSDDKAVYHGETTPVGNPRGTISLGEEFPNRPGVGFIKVPGTPGYKQPIDGAAYLRDVTAKGDRG